MLIVLIHKSSFSLLIGCGWLLLLSSCLLPPPSHKIILALVQHWRGGGNQGAEEVIARNADAIEKPDLVDGLFILQVPVHEWDRKTAGLPLVVTLIFVSRLLKPSPGSRDHLYIELLVDDRHRLELLIPGLGAGAEVAAGHHHGLQHQPVLH